MAFGQAAVQGPGTRLTMKPNQKELNEFLLDLVELLGKHFPGCFDRTKVVGGNGGLSLILRRGGGGYDSELEISTDRCRAAYRIGEVTHDPGCHGDRQGMFSAVMGDLIAIFSDRLFAVSGYASGKFLAGAFYRDRDSAEAVADFASGHPECDRIVVKKWGAPEAAV